MMMVTMAKIKMMLYLVNCYLHGKISFCLLYALLGKAAAAHIWMSPYGH
jgi:hypothetical protein